MFPSSGYFRGFNCPYYLSGLCERPYCHYRHVKLVHDDQQPPLNSTTSVLTSGSVVWSENVHTNASSNFGKVLPTSSIIGPLNSSSESIVTQSLRTRISLPPPKAASSTLSTVNHVVNVPVTTSAASTQVKEEFSTSSNTKTNIIRDLPLPTFTLTSENTSSKSLPTASLGRKCSLKSSHQPAEYDPIGSSVSARRSTDPTAYVPTPLHILEEMERQNRTSSRNQYLSSSDISVNDDYKCMELLSPPLYSPMPPPPSFSKLSTSTKRSLEVDNKDDAVVSTEVGKKVCFSEIISLDDESDHSISEPTMLDKQMTQEEDVTAKCATLNNQSLSSTCTKLPSDKAQSTPIVCEQSLHGDDLEKDDDMSVRKVKHKKSKKRKSTKCEVALQTSCNNTEDTEDKLDIDDAFKKHKKKKKKKSKKNKKKSVVDETERAQSVKQGHQSVQLLYQDIFGDSTLLVSPANEAVVALESSDDEDEYDPLEQEPISIPLAPSVVPALSEPKLPPASSSLLEVKQRLTPREVCQLRHERLQSAASSIAPPGKVRGAELSAVKTTTTMFSGPTKESSSSSVDDLNDETNVTRPRVQVDIRSKVPMNIRQRYLEKMCDECERLYRRKRLAYNRAVGEELAAYNRSANRTVYLNNVINVIKRLRKEMVNNDDSSSIVNSTLNQRLHVSTNCSISSAVSKLYHLLQPYRLTEEQLVANGFPRWDDVKKKASLPSAALERLRGNVDEVTSCSTDCTESGLPLRQVCGRCGSEFRLDAKGNYVAKQECVYHWGRAFKTRVPGVGVQSTYTCCQSELGARGCQLSPFHVHASNRWADLSDYQVTRDLPPVEGAPNSDDADYGVYALDCEMLYTTSGCELARVTVIDRHLVVVYERLVKPSQPVLDYNTRFSGLTAVNMAHATASLADVQRDLLGFIGARTLLLGHSLESDLIALKLVHSSVVDTSVVFPHRLGPPLKRALRNLASDVLNKIIQSENDSEELTGHDSKEDACICMELMLHKIREDTSRNRRLL